ncbi:hypothetical protein BC834DRAFT_870772 [Gloeopeniophorella convolvens]|nr:hypothetical protein BC834DRAFT_870772 [Gloeopeniophorella convolvens]
MLFARCFATATLVVACSSRALGALYVIAPTLQTVCRSGQACDVQWLDDGQEPLLPNMGPCNVALYAGNEKLVQQINPVDVSTTHSLTFTPNAKAGPNSNTYYIAFTSIGLSNSSHLLQEFSPNFSLEQMSGSFNSPVPELTSAIPVPSSVLSAQPNQVSTSSLSETVSLPTSVGPSLTSPSSGTSTSASSQLPLSSTPPSKPPAPANAAAQHPAWSQVFTLAVAGVSLLLSA